MIRKRWAMIRARKARGWSQSELAVAAEVGLSTVARTETVRHTPRTPEAQRMAEQLGLTLEALLAVSELVEQPAPQPPAPALPPTRKPRASKRTQLPGPVKARASKRAPKAEHAQAVG